MFLLFLLSLTLSDHMGPIPLFNTRLVRKYVLFGVWIAVRKRCVDAVSKHCGRFRRAVTVTFVILGAYLRRICHDRYFR